MDIDWKKLLSDLNTNDMVKIFMERLTAAMNNHIPMKKCSNKPRKTPLSEETRRTIREKHRDWEKYRKCKDNNSYRKYTRARNKAKSTITRERKQREKEIAESAKTNCKNFNGHISPQRGKLVVKYPNYIVRWTTILVLQTQIRRRMKY